MALLKRFGIGAPLIAAVVALIVRFKRRSGESRDQPAE
jgi:hypothetical protein